MSGSFDIVQQRIKAIQDTIERAENIYGKEDTHPILMSGSTEEHILNPSNSREMEDIKNEKFNELDVHIAALTTKFADTYLEPEEFQTEFEKNPNLLAMKEIARTAVEDIKSIWTDGLTPTPEILIGKYPDLNLNAIPDNANSREYFLQACQHIDANQIKTVKTHILDNAQRLIPNAIAYFNAKKSDEETKPFKDAFKEDIKKAVATIRPRINAITLCVEPAGVVALNRHAVDTIIGRQYSGLLRATFTSHLNHFLVVVRTVSLCQIFTFCTHQTNTNIT